MEQRGKAKGRAKYQSMNVRDFNAPGVTRATGSFGSGMELSVGRRGGEEAPRLPPWKWKLDAQWGSANFHPWKGATFLMPGFTNLLLLFCFSLLSKPSPKKDPSQKKKKVA